MLLAQENSLVFHPQTAFLFLSSNHIVIFEVSSGATTNGKSLKNQFLNEMLYL